jgi:cobalt-zinc-cadmium efflux system protein
VGHDHSASLTGRRLALSVIVTFAFVLAEGITGLLSHSLALMSDAGHNLADALALGLSWYGLHSALRPSSAERTFGYHRVGILAALVNAVALVIIALLIFGEAISHLRVPQPVASTPMIIVALIAIIMNTVISVWLQGGAKHDLNIRSAYLHMVGDAVSAVGVLMAGVIVARTGSSIADPIVSIFIGIFILWSSWGILKESVNVLLEGIPAGLSMAKVEQSIAKVHGVLAVHDLHVWTVGAGVVCCSCHIMVAEQSVRSGEQVLRAVNKELRHHFGIGHTTIQVEVEGCAKDDMYCTMQVTQDSHGPDHHHHHH